MDLEYERTTVTASLNVLKRNVFGTENIVLHRRELLKREPRFEALRNAATAAQFDRELLALLEQLEYSLITVVMDKHEHVQRYAVWRHHPYLHGLEVLLERYVRWLDRRNDTGDVVVESRGKKENMDLERAYEYLHKHGTGYVNGTVFQRRLPNEIKLRPKTATVAGLQLVNLIASPCCRSMICDRTGQQMTAPFGRQVCGLAAGKYLSNPASGRIPGWGTKWLP